MNQERRTNAEMVAHVARRLEPLLADVVFVGGAITEFLLTDPAAPVVRSTLDVDAIIEITTRTEYYALEEKLRDMGFSQRPGENQSICRWYVDSIPVDIMPTIGEVLGFSNAWYQDAIDNATEFQLNDAVTIRLVSAPYFLATKIDAFHDRGDGDYMVSPDIEDIITLLDGREEAIEEVKRSPENLRKYLSEQFINFAENTEFTESIGAHLPPDAASQERAPLILERIAKIATLA